MKFRGAAAALAVIETSGHLRTSYVYVFNSGRYFLWGVVILIVAFIGFRVAMSIRHSARIHRPMPAVVQVPQPDRVEVKLQLRRGDFTVFRYTPGQKEFATHPKAVIIFGSGDGGFDGWEDRVSKSLQADGYEILGFDCAHYAITDYDLDILQADMNTIAQSSLSRFGYDDAPPLILGGWSMGAAQAVATAGGSHRPPGTEGLLLISPGGRGRYGLRIADRFDVPPTGNGTFAMSDFSRNLDGLRVAQWDGNLDILDSTAWLKTLTATHKAYSYTYGLHDYDGASDKFLAELKKSIEWILAPPSPADK